MRLGVSALLLGPLFALSACQDPEFSVIGNGRVTESGAHQLLGPEIEAFDELRLARLISDLTPLPNSFLATYSDCQTTLARLNNTEGIPNPTNWQRSSILSCAIANFS